MIASRKCTIDWSKGIVDWYLPKELEGITFLAVGDILVEGTFLGVIEEVIKKKGGAFLLGPSRSILQSADVILGNLENPLSERGDPISKRGPHFRASPQMVKVLSDAGFTILGVANNHARDYGDHAFLDTLDCLQGAGILSVGGGRDSSSALKPVIIRTRELSIGILAFTYRQESVAKKKQPGSADLDSPECYKAVKALCDKVDLVIVFLHMGPEYSDYPAPHRIKMARRFIDLGTEMVIGHHPHVPQGLEIYKGKLIAYSLGNFLFHTEKYRSLTRLGYLLKAKLTKKGTAWARIIPYRINDSYQPWPLANKDYAKTMSYLEDISKGLHDPKVVELNWEEIAIKQTIVDIDHILRSILTRKTFSLWSRYLTPSKYRYQAFLQGLLKGRVWVYFKNWVRTRNLEVERDV